MVGGGTTMCVQKRCFNERSLSIYIVRAPVLVLVVKYVSLFLPQKEGGATYILYSEWDRECH